MSSRMPCRFGTVLKRMDGPVPMGSAELRAADRWITDMLTSVFTSREIPVNTVLGPCDLKHSSLYDSIAFIALKCSDRRTKPYMLKVDVTGAAAAESSCWLQLVQPARYADEQNLEAYVKDGQLFFRALRTIKRDAELLVWYKKDLSQLLNLNLEESEGVAPHTCPYCTQTFQFEFPLLAHQRFLCKERFLSLTASRFSKLSPPPRSLGDKPATTTTTDFHNLARDLESSRAPSGNVEKGGPNKSNKRRHSEEEEEEERESEDEVLSFSPPRGDRAGKRVCVQGRAVQLRIPVPLRHASSTSSIGAITQTQTSSPKSLGGNDTVISTGGVKHLKPKPKNDLLLKTSLPLPLSFSGSDIARSILSDSVSAGDEERKSAFIQPPRSSSSSSSSSFQTHHPVMMALPAALPHLPHLPLAASKLQRAALLQAAAHKQLLSASSIWPKPHLAASGPVLGKLTTTSLSRTSGNNGPQHHSPPPTPALLSVPLSPLAPLGLPAQNWCAKCSISFHMTSDLVQHMRSHHKRAPSLEEQQQAGDGSQQQGAKQHRRDRLRCPICKESFKERHHLSRHMTSHS
ncbi:PR domain zinc finger protein 8 [Engraulis encrasicolus]|uniref:PR domain zinc finger protein 8 n=1 Tax=Engraulis encrasicolus TaxID=184585 RepID=UPI002FD0CDC7